MPSDRHEVMALLRWDFPSNHMPSIRIAGTYEVPTLSAARAMCEALNADYGDGTHWIEPLNFTKAERAGNAK